MRVSLFLFDSIRRITPNYIRGLGSERSTGVRITTLFDPPPRFGRAVAKVRSAHLKRNRKAAAKFLRTAMDKFAPAISGGCNMSNSANQLWINLANLKPVFQYLSKQ